MRIRTVRWKRGVPIWHLVWGYREMIAKGAAIDFYPDGAWRARWP